MAKERKNGGLGQGLEELFGDVITPSPSSDKRPSSEVKSKKNVEEIAMDRIRPNSNQPRKNFNPEAIEDLAKSIEEHGIIQPILVRPMGEGYEIVAGERRYRAARSLKKKTIPSIVYEINDEENMLFAIIENMQREDLNPIEEAEGIQTMLETYDMTHEQVAKAIGKSRPQISNMTRLLKLPEVVRNYIAEGQISAGHGRTLVSLEDQEKQVQLAKKIVDKELSVRELEAHLNGKGQKKRKKPRKLKKHDDVIALEEELKIKFGTKVSIEHRGGKGKVEIEFYNSEERDRIVELLKG